MEQLKKIKQDITVNKVFSTLTQAYQEHAVEQINLARSSVLASRDFVRQLDEIFFDVKTSYHALLAKQGKKDTPANELAKNKQKKQLLVLITANNKLYGDLIIRICMNFLQAAKNVDADTDLAVIGKLGREFLQQAHLAKEYKYFELPDVKEDTEMLRPIVVELLQYESVTVFYGKFNNLVSQDSVAVKISGEYQGDQAEKKDQHAFLFEPSLEELLNFFESQVFYLLFSQTVQEAKLARFGSRINAMENAQHMIQDELSKLIHQEKRMRAIEANKKQIQQFAGRRLWKKK
jgi:ATP synthase F1 gamma subunit